MKKVLVFLIMLVLVAPFSLNFAVVKGEILDAENTFSTVDFLEEFVNNYPNRLSGTQGEKEAAEYIAGKFEELVEQAGYIPHNDKAEGKDKFFQKFDFLNRGIVKISQNVIVTKPALNGSKKTVIIGAHYDNAYMLPEGMNEKDYNFQGAYDNGTGVAVMMYLAHELKDKALDFNVTFIAFGGEEYLLKGSEYYASKLEKEELDDILIMFNLDVIGAGDKLYLYCDEVKTEHEKFLLDLSKGLGIELNSPPLDKHVALYGLNDMPYTHIGLMSDNLSFLTRGVNCAFFFTYNWKYGLSESDKNSSIIHSSNDNISVLNQRYGNTYKVFMENAGKIILNALTDESFETAMILSLNNKFDYRPFLNRIMVLIVAISILTLAGILVFLTYTNLNKNKTNSKQPEIIADPFYEKDESVFGNEFEDNIFQIES